MKFNWRKPTIYLLLYISGSKIPKYLNIIKKIAPLSIEEQKKYQTEKLKKLLLYSAQNVPYYKKILNKYQVVINNQVYLENFYQLPILTKEIIRDENTNLYSKKIRPGQYFNTSGGSTGEPIKLLQDKEYDEWNKANKIFYKLQAGQKIGEKELRFWGSERDLLAGKESLKIRIRNWLYNRKEFNTFKMSEKEMLDYVNKWNQYNPNWVESYVQSIYEFALFIERNKLTIKSPRNGILTSAGTLYPIMKETIQRVFQCKVYNRYGSREVGDMAYGEDSLKISFWNHQLEVINNNKIIVTNLNNYSMPLIRYDIGDLGILNYNKLRIEQIQGRINNLIQTSNKQIDSTAITSAFYYSSNGSLFTSFSKYQLVQKQKDSFELLIVIQKPDQWAIEQKEITSKLQKILGPQSKIIINEVSTIDCLPNGKFEYIKSEIK